MIYRTQVYITQQYKDKFVYVSRFK